MGERRAKDDGERCATCAAFIMCGLVVLSFYLLVFADGSDPTPTYSIAIGAVSGLDPATDLQDGSALDPAFNVTVRVDATSRKKDGACLHDSTSVQVSYSYLRIPLAVGRAADGVCAEAGGRRDVEVVARGRGVAVPGFLLDSLADDLWRGVAVFEVTLINPHNGGWDVTTCRGKVGDAGTLESPCWSPSWVEAVRLPVPQQPGGSSEAAACLLRKFAPIRAPCDVATIQRFPNDPRFS